VAIVLLLAAVVWKLPGGGSFAAFILELLGATLTGAIIWSGWRIGRERRFDIERLDDRERAILYGAIAVGFLAIAGRATLWATVAGSIIWMVLVAAAVVAAIHAWRTLKAL
jgi:hypothetical protein